MISIFLLMCAVSAPSPLEQPEISFDIWDWTQPCQDTQVFQAWVDDLKALGFNRMEISVPWRRLEPEPGRYDMAWLEERVRICESAGLGMRLRINSYYGGATPDWYDGDRWEDAAGNKVPQSPPSIMDERFWAHYGPLCTHIAAACRGRNILFSPFIGIHAELKWADWWSFDPSTLAAWKSAIAGPRPKWLQEVAGEEPLPDRPEIPPTTSGIPDTGTASRALIAFREACWREAVGKFERYLRQGDSEARLSAPLGESYRRQSASMSNLDYWGLSRGATQVAHSYDFFWHTKDPAWMAGASVDAFQGITGLPVVFEFDGTASMFDHNYSLPHLLALGQSAARAGAGLKFANDSYVDTLPSKQPLIGELVHLWRQAWLPAAPLARGETVLLFFSKWANYTYRESSEWLHDAQFGIYKLMCDAGIPVRIINEDNLDEDLKGYRALYLAFSPRPLLPGAAREKLAALSLPVIEDVADIPETGGTENQGVTTGLASLAVHAEGCPITAQDLSFLGKEYVYGLSLGEKKLLAYRKGHVVMGYPVGILYLRDTAPFSHQGLVLWALQQR